MTLSDFVHRQVSIRIDEVVDRASQAAQEFSEDHVHDLRVAIRRLSESLRVFEDVFAPGAAKAVRQELREAMRLAGRTRNHDIAMDLLRKARIEIPEDLPEQRNKAERKLAATVAGWNVDSAAASWREQLQ